jgi:c(7)-type cytochrome triheme protein
VQDTARPQIEGTLDPDSALTLLPRDSSGRIDWVAAIRDSVVRPRRTIAGTDRDAVGTKFPFDFYMKGPDPMFDAVFPHSSHVGWLDCRGCHPAVYRYRGEPTTMETIGRGESCGVCHRTVAFGAEVCFRCHPGMAPDAAAAEFGAELVFVRDSSVDAGGFPPAVFPHWVHRTRYACTACHPEPFALKAGETVLTMASMQGGATCGACHDGRRAFGLVDCTRCHTNPASGGAGP